MIERTSLRVEMRALPGQLAGLPSLALQRQQSRFVPTRVFDLTLLIANGAGFLGDDIDAPRRLVEAAEVDYLTLEYLAELTMSIMRLRSCGAREAALVWRRMILNSLSDSQSESGVPTRTGDWCKRTSH